MTASVATHGAGPLAGLRVLDLSAYIAGPYGCALLADQGAEVIKIEPPAGDNLRKYPSTLETESRAFLGVNRSKLGVVLDLKQAADLKTLLALVRTADVLVHNFRPSVPPRLGIGYEQLRQLNPRLVYCAVSGYGETGPLAEKAGYDQVLQAMTGICTLQGKRGGIAAIFSRAAKRNFSPPGLNTRPILFVSSMGLPEWRALMSWSPARGLCG